MSTKPLRRWSLLLLTLTLTGCGAAGSTLLTDLLSIPAGVQEACTGVMTDSEIQAAIIAARADESNGYTLAEELEFGREGCAVQLVNGVSVDDCMACKTAILNSVYGS
jgi:hypothetical protein